VRARGAGRGRSARADHARGRATARAGASRAASSASRSARRPSACWSRAAEAGAGLFLVDPAGRACGART
jgi:hypothetical protein